MNKVIALTLLLCLFGGSYAAVLVQYYDGVGCLAKNYKGEISLAEDGTGCTALDGTALYG